MAFASKSPWLIHYDAASCNGCDIEVLACLTPLYDVERFGIINTGNPRHADIFLVTGSVNVQGGIDKVIPVDVYVPGCAARPQAIIDGVVKALGILEEKSAALAAGVPVPTGTMNEKDAQYPRVLMNVGAHDEPGAAASPAPDAPTKEVATA